LLNKQHLGVGTFQNAQMLTYMRCPAWLPCDSLVYTDSLAAVETIDPIL